MKITRNMGISLILLIITIIIAVILTTVVILSLTDSNAIEQARKTSFLTDVDTFQNELATYNATQTAENRGRYTSSKLEADETSITYDGTVDNTKSINDIISLNKNPKYKGQFKIVKGNLIYIGTDTLLQAWAIEKGINTTDAANDTMAPEVIFGTNGGKLETASTIVTVNDLGGGQVNSSSLQYVWDTQNVTTPSVGWTAFNNGDTLSKRSIYSTYYLWIKASDNTGNTVVAKSNPFVVNSIENFENAQMLLNYYNVDSWELVHRDISYDGEYCYGARYLTDRQTATMEFNINDIPSDGGTYHLTYYMKHDNSADQYYDSLNVYVNGVLKYSNEFTSPETQYLWLFNDEVILNSGNNTIKFEFTTDMQQINTTGSLHIDNLQVIRY